MYIDIAMLTMLQYWAMWAVVIVALFFIASRVVSGNFKSVLAIVFILAGLYVMYLGVKGV